MTPLEKQEKVCEHKNTSIDKVPVCYGENWEVDVHIYYCEECGEVISSFLD